MEAGIKNEESTIKPDREDLLISLRTLQSLVNDSQPIVLLSEEERIALIRAAGIISRPDRDEQIKRRKYINKEKRSLVREMDKKARSATGIRQARTASIFAAPEQFRLQEAKLNMEDQELKSPRNCYVCKAEYTKLHPFYDCMCERCGDLNYAKRFQTADLTGQIALITGSRLKIGYQATIMMLRAGATVIATTRFPADSAIRFAKEHDYEIWKDRLHIHGLDLRHTPSVELFCTYIEQTYTRLDILINNAAQTVRRPAGFYAHLMEKENLPYHMHDLKVQQLLASHQNCLNKIASALPDGNENNAPAVTWHETGPGIQGNRL